MKKKPLLLCLAAALTALALPACESTGAALTVGYTGKTAAGNDYVIGLLVPLSRKKPAPVEVPEPALPTDPAPAGKSPILAAR